jgi:hypothetical protein
VCAVCVLCITAVDASECGVWRGGYDGERTDGGGRGCRREMSGAMKEEEEGSVEEKGREDEETIVERGRVYRVGG